MKKILSFIMLILLITPAVYAQSSLDDPADQASQQASDQVMRDLATLRKQMSKMRNEMNAFVKEVSAEYAAEPQAASSALGQDIKVDVTQNDKDVVVRADMPGMSKDKIEVALSNKKMLRISGERQGVKEASQPGIVQQERFYGKFERIIELPAECRNDGIRASYKDGVLEVLIPKAEKQPGDEVKIKVQ